MTSDPHNNDNDDSCFSNLPIESELSDVLAIEDQPRVCPILTKNSENQLFNKMLDLAQVAVKGEHLLALIHRTHRPCHFSH